MKPYFKYKLLKCILICALFIEFNVYSQNLVPNPSFELYDSCTSTYSEYTMESLDYYCTNWFDYGNYFFESGIAYMNNCLPLTFHVPNTILGFSYPQDGNSFIGICLTGFETSNTSVDYRAYASVALTDSLKKDSLYCVSFYYKNPSSYNKIYTTDNIGILFTSDSLTESIGKISKPHLRTETGVYLENSEWEKFRGYYVADGTEVFLNLGMFGATEDSDLSYDENEFYHCFTYFIDNFLMVECDRDSVFGVYIELPNVFTPNNDGINDLYKIKHNNIDEMTVFVHNRWGHVVRQYDGLTDGWDGRTALGKKCSDGTYFIVVQAKDNYGKTINKSKTITIFN